MHASRNKNSDSITADERQKLLKKPQSSENSVHDSDRSESSFDEVEARPVLTAEKVLKFALFALFVINIANVFYDFLLFLCLVKSPTFENFQANCRQSLTLSISLDVCLSLAGIFFALYGMKVLRDVERQIRPVSEEFNTYFAGYYLFWVGVKLVLFLTFVRNNDCVFANFWDIGLNLIPRLNPFLLFTIYFAEGASMLVLLWLFNRVLREKRRRIDEFLHST